LTLMSLLFSLNALALIVQTDDRLSNGLLVYQSEESANIVLIEKYLPESEGSLGVGEVSLKVQNDSYTFSYDKGFSVDQLAKVISQSLKASGFNLNLKLFLSSGEMVMDWNEEDGLVQGQAYLGQVSHAQLMVLDK